MLLNTKKLIELCCDKTHKQPAMHSPYLQDGKLYGTDGHMAVGVAVAHVSLDVDGPVSIESLKAARKDAKRSECLGIDLHAQAEVLIAGTSRPRNVKNFNPPTTGGEIERAATANTHFKVRFNAKFLLNIARALGNDVVCLSFTNDHTLPILITTTDDDDAGVLMPCKL